MADPYATLGVSRSATEKDIKSAYRKLAKELHPDRNSDNPKAAERFSDVTRAYDLLSDASKRAQFDRGEIDGEGNPRGFGGGGGPFGGGFNGGSPHGGFDPRDFRTAGGQGGFGGGAEGIDIGDIFEGLFGGRAGGPAGGMGGTMGGPGGQRRQAPPRKGADVQYRLRVPFVDAATLKAQRITLADGKTIDLKLPAGTEDGTQMRLKGKGEPGPAGHGDAIVTIGVENHAFFRKDGADVRLDLPVTLDEAVRGARVKVPTVDGAVMLTLKPGTSGGTVMRLKGKGFSTKGGGRGDQLVTIEIDLPDDVSDLAARLDGWTDSRNPRAKLGQ
ncbi:DnaJ C-terminal domain-containing protein [Tsuneonella sp. HG222]